MRERVCVLVMIVCVSDYRGIRVLRLVRIRYLSAVTASVCTQTAKHTHTHIQQRDNWELNI